MEMRSALASWLIAALAASQVVPVGAQGLDVSVRGSGPFTVGEPIDFEVRAHIARGAALVDSSPRPLESLPDRVRIITAEPLVRIDDSTLRGRLRVVYFRPGQQSLPGLVLVYHPTTGSELGGVHSQPVLVEIASVLPPGHQIPKDIRDIQPLGGTSSWPLVIGPLAGVAAVLGYAAYRWRRPRRRVAPVGPAVGRTPPLRRSPYELALERLAEVDAARWPDRGAVDRHYELVGDVLRRYLEEAEGVTALERTTTELIGALPPRLGDGDSSQTCRHLFGEGDLVKFARYRPDETRAAVFLSGARQLLDRWHQASAHATR